VHGHRSVESVVRLEAEWLGRTIGHDAERGAGKTDGDVWQQTLCAANHPGGIKRGAKCWRTSCVARLMRQPTTAKSLVEAMIGALAAAYSRAVAGFEPF
jgi:hypothetical protein